MFLKILLKKNTRMTEGSEVLYLYSDAITSPCYVVTRTSDTIIATGESRINTLFVCHSSCEDQHKCTPRDKRGTLNARLRWRGRGTGFYGLLIFTGSSYRDVRAD